MERLFTRLTKNLQVCREPDSKDPVPIAQLLEEEVWRSNFISLLMFLLPLVACSTLFPTPKPKATVTVTPAQVELAFPGILRIPIVFTGTGWKPKEMGG